MGTRPEESIGPSASLLGERSGITELQLQQLARFAGQQRMSTRSTSSSGHDTLSITVQVQVQVRYQHQGTLHQSTLHTIRGPNSCDGQVSDRLNHTRSGSTAPVHIQRCINLPIAKRPTSCWTTTATEGQGDFQETEQTFAPFSSPVRSFSVGHFSQEPVLFSRGQ